LLAGGLLSLFLAGVIIPMNGSLFQQWQGRSCNVQDPPTATPLKAAAVAGQLADWTACLTAAVVRSCEALGWRAAGKGHPLACCRKQGKSTWAST
jgi:hypothetical protein